MDYADVVSAFFNPSPDGAIAGPTVNASPARRLRDAIEPIAMHSVWSRTTNERLAGLGLDFLGSYVWGRASCLGEPSPGVVAATFAVFEPGFVGATYDAARLACTRDDLITARNEATITSLGTALAGETVEGAATLLERVAIGLDGTGRALYSGLRDQPWPTDPVGRLWRGCELLREHRGDSHVAACIAVGLGPVEMNVLTELWVGLPLGSYTASRGWSGERIGEAADGLRQRSLIDGDELSTEGRAMRDRIEATTDSMEQPVVEALADGIDPLIEQLSSWSARCIDAGAFPPDVYKRAAG